MEPDPVRLGPAFGGSEESGMDAYDEVMISLGLEPSSPPKGRESQARCPSEAMARRHYQLKEPVCPGCRAAKNAANRVRKRAARARRKAQAAS